MWYYTLCFSFDNVRRNIMIYSIFKIIKHLVQIMKIKNYDGNGLSVKKKPLKLGIQ